MKISIVMAYKDRKPLLIKTLQSITKTEHSDYEVIAIDDASKDEHRIEDLESSFPFLKVTRVDPENKWYYNPCIPYNMGFKQAVGEIVIIQNPECFHANDILSFISVNLKSNTWMAASCYSLNEEETAKLTINDYGKTKEIAKNNFPPTTDGGSGWYCHPQFRPSPYHFCVSLYKDDLDDLGGFDERYAMGRGYDDDEIKFRAKKKGMELLIEERILVFHQNHYSMSLFDQAKAQDLGRINCTIFNEKTLKEPGWKSNI